MADKIDRDRAKDRSIKTDVNISELDNINLDFPMADGPDMGGVSSRKPINPKKEFAVEFMKGVGGGVKSATASQLRRVMPEGAAVYDDVSATVDDFKALKDDLAKELEPMTTTLEDASRKLLPKVEKYIPKKLYDKMHKKLEERAAQRSGTYQAQSKEAAESEQIAAELGQIFGAQTAATAEVSLIAQREQQKNLMVDRALGSTRHKQSQIALMHVYDAVRSTELFHKTQHMAYMKKSLELKYKHLFVAKDTYNLLAKSMTAFEKQFEAIIQNTALPDMAKEKTRDYIRKGRTSMYGTAMSEALGNIRQKIFQNIKDKAKDAVQSFGNAVEMMGMGADAWDQADEMEAMMGGQAKDRIPGWLGQALGYFGGSPLIRKGLSKIAPYTKDLDRTARNLKSNLALKTAGIKRQWGQSGNKFKEFISEFLPDEINAAHGTNDLLSKANDAAAFDVMTRQSIVEIIPGYLGKIWHSIEKFRTGNENIEEKTFNVYSRKFTTTGELKANAIERMVGSEDTRAEMTSKVIAAMQVGASRNSTTAKPTKMFKGIEQDINKFMFNHAIKGELFDPEKIRRFLTTRDPDYYDPYIGKVTMGFDNDPRSVLKNIYDSIFNERNNDWDKDTIEEINSNIANFMSLDRYKAEMPKMFETYGMRHLMSSEMTPEEEAKLRATAEKGGKDGRDAFLKLIQHGGFVSNDDKINDAALLGSMSKMDYSNVGGNKVAYYRRNLFNDAKDSANTRRDLAKMADDAHLGGVVKAGASVYNFIGKHVALMMADEGTEDEVRAKWEKREEETDSRFADGIAEGLGLRGSESRKYEDVFDDEAEDAETPPKRDLNKKPPTVAEVKKTASKIIKEHKDAGVELSEPELKKETTRRLEGRAPKKPKRAPKSKTEKAIDSITKTGREAKKELNKRKSRFTRTAKKKGYIQATIDEVADIGESVESAVSEAYDDAKEAVTNKIAEFEKTPDGKWLKKNLKKLKKDLNARKKQLKSQYKDYVATTDTGKAIDERIKFMEELIKRAEKNGPKYLKIFREQGEEAIHDPLKFASKLGDNLGIQWHKLTDDLPPIDDPSAWGNYLSNEWSNAQKWFKENVGDSKAGKTISAWYKAGADKLDPHLESIKKFFGETGTKLGGIATRIGAKLGLTDAPEGEGVESGVADKILKVMKAWQKQQSNELHAIFQAICHTDGSIAHHAQAMNLPWPYRPIDKAIRGAFKLTKWTVEHGLDVYKKTYSAALTGAGHAIKGIGHFAGESVKAAYGAISGVAKWAVSKQQYADVYVKTENGKKLVVSARQQKDPGIFFKKSGKRVERTSDITEPCVDDHGEYVVTEDDLKAGLVYNDASPIGKIGSGLLTLGKGYFDLYGKAVKALGTIGAAAIKAVGAGLFGTADEKYVDVYRKDETAKSPLITRRQQKEEGVFFKASGKRVERSSDIHEEVVDKDGNLLVTKDDLEHGIVNVRNKPIGSGGFRGLLSGVGTLFKGVGKFAGNVATKGFDMYANMYKGLFDLGVGATKGIGKFLGRALGLNHGSGAGGAFDEEAKEATLGTWNLLKLIHADVGIIAAHFGAPAGGTPPPPETPSAGGTSGKKTPGRDARGRFVKKESTTSAEPASSDDGAGGEGGWFESIKSSLSGKSDLGDKAINLFSRVKNSVSGKKSEKPVDTSAESIMDVAKRFLETTRTHLSDMVDDVKDAVQPDEKKKSGDADGDGVVDGSYADQQKKKGPKKKEKRIDARDTHVKTDWRKKPEPTAPTGGNSGGDSGEEGGLGGLFDLLGKAKGGIGKLGGLFGKASGGLGKIGGFLKGSGKIGKLGAMAGGLSTFFKSTKWAGDNASQGPLGYFSGLSNQMSNLWDNMDNPDDNFGTRFGKKLGRGIRGAANKSYRGFAKAGKFLSNPKTALQSAAKFVSPDGSFVGRQLARVPWQQAGGALKSAGQFVGNQWARQGTMLAGKAGSMTGGLVGKAAALGKTAMPFIAKAGGLAAGKLGALAGTMGANLGGLASGIGGALGSVGVGPLAALAAAGYGAYRMGKGFTAKETMDNLGIKDERDVLFEDRLASALGMNTKIGAKAMRGLSSINPVIGLIKGIRGNDNPMTEKEVEQGRAKLNFKIKKGYPGYDKILSEYEKAIEDHNWSRARQLCGKEADNIITSMWKHSITGKVVTGLGNLLLGNKDKELDEKTIEKTRAKFNSIIKKGGTQGKNAQKLLDQFDEAVAEGNWKKAREIAHAEEKGLLGKLFTDSSGNIKWSRVLGAAGAALGPVGLLAGAVGGMIFEKTDVNKPMSEEEIKSSREWLQKMIKNGNKGAQKILDQFDEAVTEQNWKKARKLVGKDVKSNLEKLGGGLKTAGKWALRIGTLGLSTLLETDQDKPLSDEEIKKFTKKMNYLIGKNDKLAKKKLEKFEQAIAKQDWETARKIAKSPHKSLMTRAIKATWNWAIGDDGEEMSEQEQQKFRDSMNRKLKIGGSVGRMAQRRLDAFEDAVGRQNWKKARTIAEASNDGWMTSAAKGVGKAIANTWRFFAGGDGQPMSESEIEQARKEMGWAISEHKRGAEKRLDMFNDYVADEKWNKARQLAKMPYENVAKRITKAVGNWLFGSDKDAMTASEIEKFQNECEQQIKDAPNGNNPKIQKLLDMFNDAVSQENWAKARKLSKTKPEGVVQSVGKALNPFNWFKDDYEDCVEKRAELEEKAAEDETGLINKGLEEFETLVRRQKYGEAMDLAKDILKMKPGDLAAKRGYKSEEFEKILKDGKTLMAKVDGALAKEKPRFFPTIKTMRLRALKNKLVENQSGWNSEFLDDCRSTYGDITGEEEFSDIDALEPDVVKKGEQLVKDINATSDKFSWWGSPIIKSKLSSLKNEVKGDPSSWDDVTFEMWRDRLKEIAGKDAVDSSDEKKAAEQSAATGGSDTAQGGASGGTSDEVTLSDGSKVSKELLDYYGEEALVKKPWLQNVDFPGDPDDEQDALKEYNLRQKAALNGPAKQTTGTQPNRFEVNELDASEFDDVADKFAGGGFFNRLGKFAKKNIGRAGRFAKRNKGLVAASAFGPLGLGVYGASKLGKSSFSWLKDQFVSNPTTELDANGNPIVYGEAGTEAIMPIKSKPGNLLSRIGNKLGNILTGGLIGPMSDGSNVASAHAGTDAAAPMENMMANELAKSARLGASSDLLSDNRSDKPQSLSSIEQMSTILGRSQTPTVATQPSVDQSRIDEMAKQMAQMVDVNNKLFKIISAVLSKDGIKVSGLDLLTEVCSQPSASPAPQIVQVPVPSSDSGLDLRKKAM